MFLDVNGPSTSYLFNGGSPGADVVFSKTSAVWTGAHDADRFLTSYGTDQSRIVLDRLLIEGLNGSNEFSLGTDLSQVQKVGISCFFENTYNWSSKNPPFVPAAWVVGNGLPPTQSPRTPSYPWNDVGCGADGVVGVAQAFWMHSKSRIAPEFFGEADGDGISAWRTTALSRTRARRTPMATALRSLRRYVGSDATEVDAVNPATGLAGLRDDHRCRRTPRPRSFHYRRHRGTAQPEPGCERAGVQHRCHVARDQS